MGIAGTKFPVPEVLGDSVEAEQRMIGRSSLFVGIVADMSHLPFAIEGKNGRVQIEDYLGRRVGFQDHGRKQPVVEFP
jgi:hypothetical protein